MTSKEFENLANKLTSVKVNLWTKKDLRMLVFFRRDKINGDFLDVTLFVGNRRKYKEYPYKFYKTDNLNEAKDKFNDICSHISKVA